MFNISSIDRPGEGGRYEELEIVHNTSDMARRLMHTTPYVEVKKQAQEGKRRNILPSIQ